MIQFNLLPNVKMQYLKVRRTKRIVIGVSLLAMAVAIVVMLVLVSVVELAQKKHLSDLNNDIQKYSQQLKSTPHLNKTLTVQNQLKSLPDLHSQKPAATRLFGYLNKITPAAASISQLKVDFEKHTFSISGNAHSLDSVNTFADILKNAKFQETGKNANSPSKQAAFSKVVLSQFSRSTSGATYTITCDFEPDIFDNSKQIKLQVPDSGATRALLHQSHNLFKQKSGAPKSEGN
jgi:uncharacterized protein YoxC